MTVLLLGLTAVLVATPVVSGAGIVGSPQPARLSEAGLDVDEPDDESDDEPDGSQRSVPTESAEQTPATPEPVTSQPAPEDAPPVSPPPAPAPVAGTESAVPADCSAGRTVERPLAAGAVVDQQWEASRGGTDMTYVLSGVTSTAYPATNSPIAVGTREAGTRTCVVGGTVLGSTPEHHTWNYLHDQYNAACMKVVAREWMQVHNLRCDNVEDGFRPQEAGVNANDAQFFISGTYLSHIRDDCLENDYTLGGVLHDSLWEHCNTGISERPSHDRSWSTPTDETLVLDQMLIGLYDTPHEEQGGTVMGQNAIFKWSSSGNRVVIKCSVFLVTSRSLNGADSMALPPGTVIDDSACPDRPSTLVWLGGGEYPAWTGGLRVTSDRSVWDSAVTEWKARHGY